LPVVVVDVESMLRVAETAAVPLTVALAGSQTGVETPPEGPVTMQVMLTTPVNPPKGVTVTVVDADAPGLEMLRFAGALTPILGTGTPVTSIPRPFEVAAP